MDKQDDNLTFEEFNEKINSWLFDTDHEVTIFQNHARTILFQDMKVASNKEKLTELWQNYNIVRFQEQKLRNSISVSDFHINQIINIVDNLEHQINSCSNGSIKNVRVAIYSDLEFVFRSISYMTDILESIWNDENYTEEKSNNPLKNLKCLLNKQYNILENIQHKINLMETEIEDIKKYYPPCSTQI